MFNRWGAAVALVAILSPLEAGADALTYVVGPYQYNDQGAQENLGEFLNRDNYRRFGFILGIEGYKLGDVEHNPEDGETWEFWVKNLEGTGTSGYFKLVYDAASDCLLSGEEQFYCGLRVDEDGRRGMSVVLRWNMRCWATAPYRFTSTHLSSTQSTDIAPPHEFTTSRFKPVIDWIETPGLLAIGYDGDSFQDYPHPKVEAASGDIVVTLTDHLGCGLAPDDATFKVAGTIVPGSGGHAHITEDDTPATGSFVGVPPETTITNKVVAEGKVPDSGEFTLRYKAGDYGADERFRVTVSQEATTHEPAYETERDTLVLLAAAPLVELPASGDDHAFALGRVDRDDPTSDYNCHHEPMGRFAHPILAERIMRISRWYHTMFGARLSLNDISLPYGGRFDNDQDDEGDDPMTKYCHTSHRFGLDIDINSIDIGEKKMSTTYYTNEEGAQETRFDWLVRAQCMSGFDRIREEPIHFRYSGQCGI